MTFPKPKMDKSELMELGFTRHELNCYVHHKRSPEYIIRVSQRGKVFFDTEVFGKLLARGVLQL